MMAGRSKAPRSSPRLSRRHLNEAAQAILGHQRRALDISIMRGGAAFTAEMLRDNPSMNPEEIVDQIALYLTKVRDHVRRTAHKKCPP